MATAGPDMYSAGSASVEPSGSSALTSLLASSLASQLQQQPAGPAIEGGRPPGDPTVQIFRSTASALAARNAKRLQQLSSVSGQLLVKLPSFRNATSALHTCRSNSTP